MGFAITGPDSIILNQGESKPSVLQIVKAAKPWRNVGLTVSGLPNGVTAEFFPSNGKPSFNSTMTLRSADNSITGTFTIIVTARDARSSQTMPIIFSNYQPPNVPGPIPPPSAPVLSSLSPSSITEDTGAFTLTVNGSGFVSGAVVSWNGSTRTTTFVNSGQVTAAILSGDITTPGTASVTATNPGSSSSNSLTFTINAAGGFTADVWVAQTGGSSGNSGLDEAHPKATIAQGLAILGAGQKMAVKAGTYDERPSIVGGNSEGNRKTMIAYPGDTVTVRPTAASGNIINWVPSSNEYFTIDGFTFDCTNITFGGCFSVGTDNGGTPFFTLQNFIIKNFALTGDGQGIGCSGNGLILRNGEIFNWGHVSSNQNHGIYLASGTGALIENLYIHDNNGGGEGMQIYGAIQPTSATIRKCTLVNCFVGILLDGSGHIVSNCIFYNNTGWSGITIQGSSCLVYHSTFYSNGYGVRNAGSSAIVRNNLLISNSSGDLSNLGSWTEDHNVVTGTAASHWVTPGSNFHLLTGSTARNAGTPLSGSVPDDYDGVTRDTVTPDAGAYEYI